MNLSSFVSKDRLLSRPSLSTMQFFLALGATCLSAALLQNGYHAWNVWQTQLYHALLWLQWG